MPPPQAMPTTTTITSETALVLRRAPQPTCKAPHPSHRGRRTDRACPLHRSERRHHATHLAERPRPSRVAKCPSNEIGARSTHSNLLQPRPVWHGCGSAASATTSRKKLRMQSPPFQSRVGTRGPLPAYPSTTP
jgi:hypothetical protein